MWEVRQARMAEELSSHSLLHPDIRAMQPTSTICSAGAPRTLGYRQVWGGPCTGLALLPVTLQCSSTSSFSLDSHFLDHHISHFFYPVSPKCLPSIPFSPFPGPPPESQSPSSLAWTRQTHFYSFVAQPILPTTASVTLKCQSSA